MKHARTIQPTLAFVALASAWGCGTDNEGPKAISDAGMAQVPTPTGGREGGSNGGAGAIGGSLSTGGRASGGVSGVGGASGTSGASGAGGTPGASGGSGTSGASGNDGGPEASTGTGGGDSGITGAGGLAHLGDDCPKGGELACAGNAQEQRLVCDPTYHKWIRNGSCDGQGEVPQLCDTEPGPKQGTCQDLQAGCAGHLPGDHVCVGTEVHACGPDLMTSTVVTTCVAPTPDCKNGGCTCGSGAVCNGTCCQGSHPSPYGPTFPGCCLAGGSCGFDLSVGATVSNARVVGCQAPAQAGSTTAACPAVTFTATIGPKPSFTMRGCCKLEGECGYLSTDATYLGQAVLPDVGCFAERDMSLVGGADAGVPISLPCRPFGDAGPD